MNNGIPPFPKNQPNDSLDQKMKSLYTWKTKSLFQFSRQNSTTMPIKKPSELSDITAASGSASKPGDYLHMYFTLKSQKTVLSDILRNFEENEQKHAYQTSEEKRCVLLAKDYLKSIINCSYGELYIITTVIINMLQPMIKNPTFSNKTHKLLEHFLNSVMSISRFFHAIINAFQLPHQTAKSLDDETSNEDNVENKYSDLADKNFRNINQNDTIVCRICNEHVPWELFEEHTKSCIEAYQTEERIKQIQENINDLQNQLCEHFLRFGWPGDQDKAVFQILPMLRISLLLERTYQIDPKGYKSIDELQYIFHIISQIDVRILNSFVNIKNDPFYQIFNSIREQVQLKEKTSTIIQQTAEILKKTRLSGNDDTEKIAQTQLSDYIFIKRISAGAFARVFLAKRKVTNDIYAIKVLPKDDVVMKNQVKRVVLEKDILLSFNNPYIINFCMSLLLKNKTSISFFLEFNQK